MEIPAIRIGTAAWSIPKQYATQFPGAGSHLEKYAARLNAVEINSSFYRPHRRQTYERWARTVPADFRFSVKIPKVITHEHALADCAEPLRRFVEEVSGLGAKLGVLLVQLPPGFAFEPDITAEFFSTLHACIDVKIACEPRHPSWFTDAANALLVAHRIARVAADPAPAAGAGEPAGWTEFVYYRLHGSPRIYYSNYEPAALADMRNRLSRRRAEAQEAWCIFDNTAASAALGNALDLRDRVT